MSYTHLSVLNPLRSSYIQILLSSKYQEKWSCFPATLCILLWNSSRLEKELNAFYMTIYSEPKCRRYLRYINKENKKTFKVH